MKLSALAIIFVCSAFAAPAPNEGYIGSEACARCHAGLYARYVKTAMGRSVVSASETASLGPSHPITRTADGITYEIDKRGADLYETEYQLDASGKDVFRVRFKLEYAIGSGFNGITYVVRRGNYLFEAPLSYYARSRTWELSPGYENTRTGFSRLVPESCIACHSGRPRAVAGREGLYLDPPFAQAAVGCENCHGPGAAHAAYPAKNNITNPRRLSAQLASDICMNCHEAGDTRVSRPGKTSADFHPGASLSSTTAILKIPPSPGGASKDLLEHNFSMLLSGCYRATNGRMGCVTCHDVHSAPGPPSAPAYYEKKCLACHTAQNCELPIAERVHAPSGCIGCHMPKADIGFIAHSALTNHRIVRHPGEPLPDEAFHLTTPELPDLIYLNRSAANPLTPLMLAEAWGELSNRFPQYRPNYLESLARIAPEHQTPLIIASLGMKAASEGAPANAVAIDMLTRAIEGGFTGPAAFETLAATFSAESRHADAIAILKRGIALSPWSPRLQKTLALEYIRTRQYDLARQTLVDCGAAFPEDRLIPQILARLRQ